MRVRIVEVIDGNKERYYKIQEKWFLLWNDSCDLETGMIWPTFKTLEEAEEYVRSTYMQAERVVKEYDSKGIDLWKK